MSLSCFITYNPAVTTFTGRRDSIAPGEIAYVEKVMRRLSIVLRLP